MNRDNLTRTKAKDETLLALFKRQIKSFKTATTNHLSEVMIVIGVVCLGLGAVLKGYPLGWLVPGLDEGAWLFDGGKIILGAGVFAVLLKSRQFAVIFRKHIYQVVFNPQNYETRESLISSWVNFSSYLLKDILPKRYHGAVKRIQEQFFDEELEYHFEDYSITYDISLIEGHVVEVNHTSKGKVVVSPHAEAPKIEQYMKVLSDDNQLLLESLIVDNQPVPKEDWNFVEDPQDASSRVFSYTLDRVGAQSSENDLTHYIERTYRFRQNLDSEPYFLTNVERYVKGFQVRAKVPKGLKVVFKQFGVGGNKEITPYVDGNGYTTWVLAASGKDLILPGQGFILILSLGG